MRVAATLSILIPLYNEEEFVALLLERVLAAPLPEGIGREIIVVDDGSKDDSVAEVERVIGQHADARIRLIRHEQNRGQ